MVDVNPAGAGQVEAVVEAPPGARGDAAIGAHLDVSSISDQHAVTGVAAAAFCVLAGAICSSAVSKTPGVAGPLITVEQIGDKLMTDYVLPLEVIGLLLTAALIGAVIIAMQERRRS